MHSQTPTYISSHEVPGEKRTVTLIIQVYQNFLDHTQLYQWSAHSKYLRSLFVCQLELQRKVFTYFYALLENILGEYEHFIKTS